MRTAMLLWVGLATIGGSTASWGASGDGFRAGNSLLTWDRLQGRMTMVTTSAYRYDVGVDGNGSRVSSLSLMGDYYMGGPLRTGISGGLRATSGVWLGSRSAPGISLPTTGSGWGAASRGLASGFGSTDGIAETSTTPYLGVGYTGLSDKGGWGVSADLGLMARNPGSMVRFGRVFSGSQALDDAVREMRWSPLLQLGVSYSF
jgi:hypothetical protein